MHVTLGVYVSVCACERERERKLTWSVLNSRTELETERGLEEWRSDENYRKYFNLAFCVVLPSIW